jgi:hypothetical protein
MQASQLAVLLRGLNTYAYVAIAAAGGLHPPTWELELCLPPLAPLHPLACSLPIHATANSCDHGTITGEA